MYVTLHDAWQNDNGWLTLYAIFWVMMWIPHQGMFVVTSGAGKIPFLTL